MRFINSTTLNFEEFASEAALKYAILSHRWQGPHEVLFEDMRSLEVAKQKKGFLKLENLCREARERNYHYVWIDTCCINKDSSAELSEAIDSMFRLYRNAGECYVYLQDVEARDVARGFPRSEWFERGWTLQELLAPKRLVFFDRRWSEIGLKETLTDMIHEATGISKTALEGQNISEFSIATRLSWAATRKTARIEDRAYSLMGLFDVNMPMLYGEGDKAFIRLQEEIIKHSTDQSIFAWDEVPEEGSGLLAHSPACFRHSGTITNYAGDTDEPKTYQMTNRGLSIELRITPWMFDTYAALLTCGTIQGSSVVILLRKLSGGQYKRIRAPDSHEADGLDYLTNVDSVFKNSKRVIKDVLVHVRQGSLIASSSGPFAHVSPLPMYGFKIIPGQTLKLEDLTVRNGEWDPQTGIALLKPGQFGPVATIDLRALDAQIAVIKIGFSFDFRPRCVVAGSKHIKMLDGPNIHAYTLRDLSIWNVSCAETWHWLHRDNPNSNSVLPMQAYLSDDPSRPNYDDCDLWPLEVDSNEQERCFHLRRSKLNRFSRPMGEEKPGNITISPPSSHSQFVWAIKIDLKPQGIERRSGQIASGHQGYDLAIVYYRICD